MSAATVTLHLRYTAGHGWYIIESNPARVFPSTNTHERVIAGPYTSMEQAVTEREKIAAAFDMGEGGGGPSLRVVPS